VKIRPLLGAIAVTALLALYVVAVLGRVVALVQTGEPVAVVFGLGVAVLPVLVVGLLVREWWTGVTVQRMAGVLAADGELPVDTLPRSPGGRIDRSAADAQFGEYRDRVTAEPESWRAWYLLAFAYDASGDRKRARSSLRTAAGFFRAERRAR
jgi:cytochrome c-type biogenesis protein CcmH/NrfG